MENHHYIFKRRSMRNRIDIYDQELDVFLFLWKIQFEAITMTFLIFLDRNDLVLG